MSEFAPYSEVRSEIKWGLSADRQSFACNLLDEYGFVCQHASRRVISLYYDDANFAFFRQGEEGLVPRSKFRIRCYDDVSRLGSNARVEIKTTGMTGRTKYALPLDYSSASTLPWAVRELCHRFKTDRIRPVTLVSYRRRYFVNDLGYRATIDVDIQYQRVVRFDGKKVLAAPPVREPECVLELKTAINRAPLNFCDSIPLARTRFSKYSQSLIETAAAGSLPFLPR